MSIVTKSRDEFVEDGKNILCLYESSILSHKFVGEIIEYFDGESWRCEESYDSLSLNIYWHNVSIGVPSIENFNSVVNIKSKNGLCYFLTDSNDYPFVLSLSEGLKFELPGKKKFLEENFDFSNAFPQLPTCVCVEKDNLPDIDDNSIS